MYYFVLNESTAVITNKKDVLRESLFALITQK